MTASRLASSTIARGLAAALAALAAPAALAGDSSLRCAGGIVSVGDSALDLLAKCGSPALRDRRVDEQWRMSAGAEARPELVGVGRRTTVVVEEWWYDFGANAFTYAVELRN